ncbi:MAG: phosphatase PAP2 family protein, partial [Alphaproteobacteria bacterium]|nr:phosphatase PAP2 family protein [Alphaproteobacteria bacterium]
MEAHRGVFIYGAVLLLAAALFSAVPGLDVAAAGWFYRGGFVLADETVFRFVFRLVYWVTDALAILLPLALVVILWRRRPLCGVDRLGAIFLVVSLAVGPGLIVNSALKDHWGRARPRQIVEFGGSRHFTPVLEPSDQCDRNCSFPAGHPAIGFYFVSFAFLIPAARARRRVFGAAILAGAAIGLMRMAQGAHFLSDVVFSGLIVTGSSWLLYQLIAKRGAAAALRGRPRLLAASLACLLAGAIAYFFFDRPVAVLAHGQGPRVVALFGFITQFGLSKGYLIISAAAFALLWLVGGRWRVHAWRAAFVFVNVAVSGIAADIIKVIVARARPKLFLSHGAFGFEWFRWGSDHWSFPSGHSATATALALSLTTIWPRLSAAWWTAALLICASRVIIGAHYPSDVLGGFYLALLTWWATRSWLG